MTTLAQISDNLRSLKRASGWASRVEKLESTGDMGSHANISAIHAKTSPRNMPPSKTAPDTQILAEELALAALIHSDLMSIRLPNVSYACLNGKTLPCRAIGGDFFDAIALTDALCAVVADVSGKGAPAAIVAAMLQGIIHAQMSADQPLTAIAGTINEFLCSRATGKFATMVLLKVRANGTVEYVNCGHVLPVLVSSTSVRRLEGSNLVVGLVATAQYKAENCELMRGDRILIFTDGITEAENSRGDQFGDSAIECRNHLCSVESVFEHVSKFHGSPERSDDWTLFELLYQGGESLGSGPR
jgi:sigma-B regulation protein RsbU (phosphoserine phosphatase)